MVVSILVHPHDYGGLWPELPQNCAFTDISVLQFLGLRRPEELSWVVWVQGLSRGRISEDSAGHVLATGHLYPRMTSQRSGGAGRTRHQRDTLLSLHTPSLRAGPGVPPALTGGGMGLCFLRGETSRELGDTYSNPRDCHFPLAAVPTAPKRPVQASCPCLRDSGWHCRRDGTSSRRTTCQPGAS